MVGVEAVKSTYGIDSTSTDGAAVGATAGVVAIGGKVGTAATAVGGTGVGGMGVGGIGVGGMGVGGISVGVKVRVGVGGILVGVKVRVAVGGLGVGGIG